MHVCKCSVDLKSTVYRHVICWEFETLVTDKSLLVPTHSTQSRDSSLCQCNIVVWAMLKLKLYVLYIRLYCTEKENPMCTYNVFYLRFINAIYFFCRNIYSNAAEYYAILNYENYPNQSFWTFWVIASF